MWWDLFMKLNGALERGGVLRLNRMNIGEGRRTVMSNESMEIKRIATTTYYPSSGSVRLLSCDRDR